MKRIKDERLIIRNLENVRWAFGIENLAALAILASELINRRPWNAILSLKNPAFLLVFIGSMVLVVLSLNVAGPIEGGKRKLSTRFLIMAFLLEWLFWGGLLLDGLGVQSDAALGDLWVDSGAGDDREHAVY